MAVRGLYNGIRVLGTNMAWTVIPITGGAGSLSMVDVANELRWAILERACLTSYWATAVAALSSPLAAGKKIKSYTSYIDGLIASGSFYWDDGSEGWQLVSTATNTGTTPKLKNVFELAFGSGTSWRENYSAGRKDTAAAIDDMRLVLNCLKTTGVNSSVSYGKWRTAGPTTAQASCAAALAALSGFTDSTSDSSVSYEWFEAYSSTPRSRAWEAFFNFEITVPSPIKSGYESITTLSTTSTSSYGTAEVTGGADAVDNRYNPAIYTLYDLQRTSVHNVRHSTSEAYPTTMSGSRAFGSAAGSITIPSGSIYDTVPYDMPITLSIGVNKFTIHPDASMDDATTSGCCIGYYSPSWYGQSYAGVRTNNTKPYLISWDLDKLG